MKRIGLKIAILAIIGLVAPSWVAAEESASVRNCTWCHGISGKGFTVAPRLAGQRRQYIESQLQSFHQHTRDNPFSRQYMWGAVAALRPDAARDLAAYFATLPAKAANDGRSDLAAAGQKIYDEGIPDANIVACLACHGPAAEGVREIPRLGGLSYSYLKRRLREWGEGYHSGSEFPMPQVATKLGQNEIEALASYLSFVK
jgi:cytochrome c553